MTNILPFISAVNRTILGQSYGGTKEAIEKPSGQYDAYAYWNEDASAGLRYMFLNNVFISVDILNSVSIAEKSVYFDDITEDDVSDAVDVAVKIIGPLFGIPINESLMKFQ